MKNDVGCICGTTAFPAFHYPPCTALPQGAMTPPDSDAHEVCNPMGARRVIRALRLRAEKDASQEVTLPLPLAQHILAALEHGWMREQDPHDLARELRAVIGK